VSEEWNAADGIAISFFLFAGATCLAPLLLLVAEPSDSLPPIIFGMGGVAGGAMASHHNLTRLREPLVGLVLLLLYLGSLAVSSREHMINNWHIPLVGLLGALAGAWSARLVTRRRSTRLGLAITAIAFLVGVVVVGVMRGVPAPGDQLDTASPLGVVVCLAVFALAVTVAYRRGLGVGAWSLFFGAGLLSIDWLPGLLIPPILIGTSIALISWGFGFLARSRKPVKEKIPPGRVVND
jgi:hypothetical protein